MLASPRPGMNCSLGETVLVSSCCHRSVLGLFECLLELESGHALVELSNCLPVVVFDSPGYMEWMYSPLPKLRDVTDFHSI
ncbi:hypothetical protein Nepgr_010457 [Nepenthes gracilis]|uniref:Uncharacterized protein n=1 Tax=Nepenthes gracilis TaxID=150966 RepID=A0AAD3SCR6_NEPGR|nr:hypothetical protein Nepgr_010457 [Nepenthes gracilis]